MSYDVRSPYSGKSYSIQRLEIDGRESVDNLIEFTAWEGLDSGLVEAQVILTSNNRVWADLDIRDGDVTVDIEFSEFSEDQSVFSSFFGRPSTWKRSMTVISIDKYLIDSRAQQEIIHLSLGNPAIIESTKTRISKSWPDNYYSDIVDDLLGAIGIRGADVQRTFQKNKIILPNVQPIEAINWCSGGAIDGQGRVGRWRLWEDNSGVHWRDVVSTISDRETHEYEIGTDMDRANDNDQFIPETDWSPGVLLDRYDWNTTLQGGSRTVQVNILNRKLEYQDRSITDVLGFRRRINPSPLNGEQGANDIFSWDDSVRPSKALSGQYIGAAEARGYATATITVPGRVGIYPGDKLEIVHRDPDGNVIPHNSGTWAIRTVKHRVSREEFMQMLGLYRLTQ